MCAHRRAASSWLLGLALLVLLLGQNAVDVLASIKDPYKVRSSGGLRQSNRTMEI